MSPPLEITGRKLLPDDARIWIWPAIAAIVMGGSLVFWCLAAMFWLVTHPVQPVIVWEPPAAAAWEQQTPPAYVDGKRGGS